MKIYAKFPVQLNGHIFSKGEACEYGGPVTRRIVDNFVDAEGRALSVSGDSDGQHGSRGNDPDGARKMIIEKTVEVLGKDGVCLQLDGLGVTYNPKSKVEELAELLLVTKGELQD